MGLAKSRLLACFLLAGLPLVAAHCRSAPAAGPGPIVETVGKGGSAESAGLKSSDLLVAWVRSASGPNRAAQGALSSPFDLVEAEVEQAPRGPVAVEVRRDGQDRWLPMPPGEWRLTTVSAAARSDHQRAAALLEQGKHEEAAAEWARAADDLVVRRALLEACWLRILAGRALAERKHWDAAHTAFSAARETARQAKDARAEAVVWEEQADVQVAEAALAKADDGYAQAVLLREREAPASLGVAALLHKRGRVAFYRDDMDASFGFATAALAQRQALAPESLAVSASLDQMGSSAFMRGDAEQAEDLYRRALAIIERIAPDSERAGRLWANLGNALRARGDTVSGEQYVRRSLALAERWVPGTANHAATLNLLGILHEERGDLDRAGDFYRRALAVVEQLSPRSLQVAGYTNNLAEVARKGGDRTRAERLHRQALAMREQIAPGRADVAASLNNLGMVARERGDFVEAEKLLRRALVIKQALAPGSLLEASTHFELGEVALGRGDNRAALDRHQEAFRLRSKRAPGGILEAESLFALGTVHRRQGRSAEAAVAWERGLGELEAVRGRLRGSDGGNFGATYAGFYHDLMELRVGQGRTSDAFALLERSRSRGLVAMLAERDLVFADVPKDLERERRQADGEYDRTLAALGRLDATADSARAEELGLKLAELRARRAQVAHRLREAAPHLAALRYPEPLSIKAAAAALPPGALLLAYSVGEKGTLLFAVPADAGVAPAVFALPLGDEALRSRIAVFRGLIERGRQRAELDDALLVQSARLWTDLLKPAESLLRGATRLVIVPDGPLHTLPFAALVENRAPPSFLAERLPLHTVLSATLYDQLRRLPRPPRMGPVLVAFGDSPRSDQAGAAALGALSFTRDEVERIARVFDPEASRHLGADATEERAKQLGRGPRYIHFASHAVLDRRVPLDSGLVLGPASTTGTPAENGLLQAWEIFERLRIDADLVTLSACDTGLGRERAGEGLVGLSRAFQYAGARAVLASLWAVADRSTPGLMEAFYRAVKEGKPKDEALRQAQVQMIRAGAHPFHWAAFQVSGDGN